VELKWVELELKIQFLLLIGNRNQKKELELADSISSPHTTWWDITPVPLRTYQRRRRRITSAPLWLWFWALLVYESVDIIGWSCSPYFILFVVFRLSPIGLCLNQ